MVFRVRPFLAVLLLCSGLAAQGSLEEKPAGSAPNGVPSHPWRGVLEDAAGVPVSNVVLELYAPDHVPLGSTTSAGDGSFEFPQTPEGPCELSVTLRSGPVSVTVFPVGMSQLSRVQLPRTPPPSAATGADTTGAGMTVSVHDLAGDRAAPAKARHELQQAGAALHKREWAKAFSKADAAVQAGPRWFRAYLFRGLLFLEQGLYPQAERDLVTAVRFNPQGAQAYVVLGTLSRRMNLPAQAELYLAQALRNDAELWQGYFELGRLRLQQRRYAEAARLATQALQATPPGDLECYLLRATAYRALGQTEAAANDLRTFLKQAKSDHAARASAQQALAELTAH